MSGAIEAIFRREHGRCVATLIRVVGDIDLAEDAVADALARAAERWPLDGVPANPGAWLVTVARNRARDVLRRESTRLSRSLAAMRMAEGDAVSPLTLGDLDVVDDDQLRLMFLCCHPALAVDAQVALTLRLLGGLETEQIAAAFLTPTATIAQRLVRAKRKIRDTHMAYRVPGPADLPARLPAVLAVIYLIAAEGHRSSAGEGLDRPDLAAEALRLARTLAGLMPEQPEVQGLLALLLLIASRRDAAAAPDGTPIVLADQDRTRWDRSLIAEGQTIVRHVLATGRPGPYQLQAAIQAVHADAASTASTDWQQILGLYDLLLTMRADDVVRLNRAVVVAELDGPRAGLAELAELDLEDFHRFHIARAELLRRAGEHDAALAAYDRALALTRNAAERRFLQDRMAGSQPG